MQFLGQSCMIKHCPIPKHYAETMTKVARSHVRYKEGTTCILMQWFSCGDGIRNGENEVLPNQETPRNLNFHSSLKVMNTYISALIALFCFVRKRS